MIDKIFNFILDNPSGFFLLFLVLFFGKIFYNGYEYTKYKNLFKSECEAKGGVMFVPKGIHGWPVPECRNSNSIIEVQL